MQKSNELGVPLGLYAALQGLSLKFGPSPAGVAEPAKPAVHYRSPVKKFYLTTAINYTNGDPHFGHAYEAITSDMIVRYHRSCGRDVFFLTGTDEHGQKVQRSAEEGKKTPKEHCDYFAARFKALDELLNIEYDRFIRTTDEDHKRTVKKLWRKVKQDIYLSNYEGWYNRYDEMYVSPAEIELAEKNDKGVPLDERGRELEKKNEEAYFFRMSKYAKRLKEHIQANPSFIQPASARADIVAFLEQNELEDLCVSRTSISWGIPVPTDDESKDDPKHVMYVWFDALTNYVSGVNGLDASSPLAKYWPASVHVVGKDIVRFHTVYWPTMLMAAEVPLPECVFAHGFITAKDGQKMGKSLGNARDPIQQVGLYGVDAVRYYMARAAAFGWDLAYNEEHLCDNNNDIILKGYGNLVQRCYKVACDNLPLDASTKAPLIPSDQPIGMPFDLEALKSEFEACFSVLPVGVSSGNERCGLRLRDAVCYLEKCVSDANAFVDKCEPWKRKGDEHALYRRQCARAFLDASFCLTHFYRIFIPNLANRIMREVLQADFVKNVLTDLTCDFKNLPVGHAIRPFDASNPLLLVDPLEPEVGRKARPLTGEELVRQKQEEKNKKQAQVVANKVAKETAKTNPVMPIDHVEIRVGKIISAEIVPGTKLVREKVLVTEGEDAVDVISGIADFYPEPEKQLVGKRVVIVLNLEPFSPKQLPDFVSRGMLLAAKSADKLELVQPPVSAVLGERLVSAGSALLARPAEWGAKLPKVTGKPWEKAKGSLKVDSEGTVLTSEHKLICVTCQAERCFAETIRDSPVQ